MSRVIIWFAYFSFYYVTAHNDTNDKYNISITTIFTTEGTTSSSNVYERENNGSSSNTGCECVPYYLCNNGKIIDNGVVIDARIENECINYLEICCGADEKVTEPITPKPNPDKPHSCGTRNIEGVGFRITGIQDSATQFGEFPWMVALLKTETNTEKEEVKYKYQCGASLIHPHVVLTAAHCVISKTAKYKIRAGEWDTQTTYELFPYQDRDVKTIIVHPKFYSGALYYDYVLLILESPVEITDNVGVICLPNKGVVIDNLSCYATGWGKEVFGMEGRYQAILKKLNYRL